MLINMTIDYSLFINKNITLIQHLFTELCYTLPGWNVKLNILPSPMTPVHLTWWRQGHLWVNDTREFRDLSRRKWVDHTSLTLNAAFPSEAPLTPAHFRTIPWRAGQHCEAWKEMVLTSWPWVHSAQGRAVVISTNTAAILSSSTLLLSEN